MVKNKRYSKALRHAVLTAYFSGEERMVDIGRRFGVCKGTIGTWACRHRDEYLHLSGSSSDCSIFAPKAEEKESPMPKEELTSAELESRLKVLEQQLEHERMRSACLDTLIDIAERDLNIVIRKKSGAKQ